MVCLASEVGKVKRQVKEREACCVCSLGSSVKKKKKEGRKGSDMQGLGKPCIMFPLTEGQAHVG